MERHPTTAILLCCRSCGLIRISDDYASAHARGVAHTALSKHSDIRYTLIDAPDRVRDEEERSQKGVQGYVEEGR